METRGSDPVRQAVEDRDLPLSDIPTIDLYMDQIITLLQDRLSPEAGGERPLTKTMINNYSKEGLVRPIKGKKYTKEHIVQMLAIYHLKNTLSIQEIKRLFQWAYNEPGFGSADLLEGYAAFLEEKPALRDHALALYDRLRSGKEGEAPAARDGLALVLELAAASAYLKALAQAVLDQAIPGEKK